MGQRRLIDKRFDRIRFTKRHIKEDYDMKKVLNDILSALPFNGQKLNIGLAIGALLQLAPQVLSFLPAHYAAIASAVLVLVGAIHKTVK
jgi:tryptophan-rich sensory protein